MTKAIILSYVAFQALTSLTLVLSAPKPDTPKWLHPWRVACMLLELALFVVGWIYL